MVPTAEPYSKRTSHGMILGANGEKMSKSRGNVVNPDEIVDEFGADTMRLYEMFIGDFEKAAPWQPNGVKGCRRFVDRYYNLQELLVNEDVIRPELEGAFHKTIKKVGNDIENLKFNTAIAALMSLMNDVYAFGSISKKELEIFTILISPFAPHIAEEVWEEQSLGTQLVAQAQWPEYDESKCVEDTVEIAVQVNGKIKARIMIAADSDNDSAISAAKSDEKVASELAGKNIIKEIYVKGKLVNIVAK